MELEKNDTRNEAGGAYDGSVFPKYIQVFPSFWFTLEMADLFRDLLNEDFVHDNVKRNLKFFVPFVPFKPLNEEGGRSDTVLNRSLLEDTHLLSNNLKRHHKETLSPEERTGYEPVHWRAVHARLGKDPRMSHRRINRSVVNRTDGEFRRGNADNRLSFVFQNYFLVRQHFTFGETHVSHGEVHLFVLYGVPVLICVSKRGREFPGASFNASWMNAHVPYLARPDAGATCTLFVVRENRSYVLLTLQKTCFRIFRLTSELFENFARCPKPAENSAPVAINEAEEESRLFRPLSDGDLLEKFGPKKRRNESEIPPIDALLWYPRIKSQSDADGESAISAAAVAAVAAAIDSARSPHDSASQARPPASSSSAAAAAAASSTFSSTTPVERQHGVVALPHYAPLASPTTTTIPRFSSNPPETYRNDLNIQPINFDSDVFRESFLRSNATIQTAHEEPTAIVFRLNV